MDSNIIWRVAKNEYIKWITNPKLLMVLIMLLFAYDYAIQELLDAAAKIGTKLQFLEGFIAISNSQLLGMIIPIVFIGIMGDFPRVDSNAMFYIYRVGKANWLIGEMLFALLSSATYLLSLLSFSVLAVLRGCYFSNRWSEVTTKYYIYEPLEYDSKVANLITGRLYNNLNPLEATLNIMGLMFLLLVFLSMMLITGFACKKRIEGMVIAVALICLGNIMTYIETGVRWGFPTSHSVLAIHFDEIYRKPIVDIRLSYIYYAFLILLFFVIAIQKIGAYDFSKIQELEE